MYSSDFGPMRSHSLMTKDETGELSEGHPTTFGTSTDSDATFADRFTQEANQYAKDNPSQCGG
jgi:hypothetical protein